MLFMLSTSVQTWGIYFTNPRLAVSGLLGAAETERNNQFSNPLELDEGKKEEHICPHRAAIALLPTPSPEKAELGEGTAPPITTEESIKMAKIVPKYTFSQDSHL